MTGLARDASACSTAMRTSGLPSTSRQQLVGAAHAGGASGGEDDRGDTPCACDRLVARLRPGDDLHQQPADAHAGDVLARRPECRRAGASAPNRSRYPSGCARSPARRARDGRDARPSSSRLPGSTGMPKCSIAPPTVSIALGITSRRSAMAEAPKTIDQLGACLQHRLERLRQRGFLMRHAALGDDFRAGGRQPLPRHLDGLVDDLLRQSRQHGRDHADLAQLIGRDPDRRLAFAAAERLRREVWRPPRRG